MREYGQVPCSLWHLAAEQGWSEGAAMLAVYLLTSPHSNGIGCYALPTGYATTDLRISSETLSERFTELSRNGYAYRFGTVVFIPDFLRGNQFANGNVASARVGEWRALPVGEAKTLAARALLEFGRHLTDAQRRELETVGGTVTQTVREQDPDPDPDPTKTQRGDSPDGLFAPGDGAGAAPRAKTCPQAEIVALYHEVLPSLTRVRDWHDGRQSMLRARWRESAERQSLDWWRGFFEYVSRSDFLMGRVETNRGVFDNCDLEWLIKPKNFAKVIEGKYENRRAAA